MKDNKKDTKKLIKITELITTGVIKCIAFYNKENNFALGLKSGFI